MAGIEATEVVPGRTEYIDLQQNFQVLVDSADTPEALSRLLDDVKMSGARKILLVFGCEGLQDVGKRPYMGEVAHYKVSVCPAPCQLDSVTQVDAVFRLVMCSCLPQAFLLELCMHVHSKCSKSHASSGWVLLS